MLGGAMQSGKNVVVEVKLLDNDVDVAAHGLPVWFGDSSQPTMARAVRSPVKYHAKKVCCRRWFLLRFITMHTSTPSNSLDSKLQSLNFDYQCLSMINIIWCLHFIMFHWIGKNREFSFAVLRLH
jgi:hypothetical protein